MKPWIINDYQSALEVYEFLEDPPDKYFAYVDEKEMRLITWTGQTLGKIIKMGGKFKGNMGDDRITIIVKGINGREYYGTYYCSAGDYARIKAYKNDN